MLAIASLDEIGERNGTAGVEVGAVGAAGVGAAAGRFQDAVGQGAAAARCFLGRLDQQLHRLWPAIVVLCVCVYQIKEAEKSKRVMMNTYFP